MSYGPVVIFANSMASAGTLTSGSDLGKSWNKVYLEVPTMNSAAEIYIQASTNNSTFRRVQVVADLIKSYSVSITSGVTLTSAIDLGEGAYNAYLLVPSLATGTSINIHGSLDNSTFSKVQLLSSGVVDTDFSITTIAVNTRKLCPIPHGLRYVKVELATGVTQLTHTFKLLASVKNALVDYSIPSSVSSRMVPIPGNFRYVKVETDATVDNGAVFNIVCSD